jgi:hypothetical protein
MSNGNGCFAMARFWIRNPFRRPWSHPIPRDPLWSYVRELAISRTFDPIPYLEQTFWHRCCSLDEKLIVEVLDMKLVHHSLENPRSFAPTSLAPRNACWRWLESFLHLLVGLPIVVLWFLLYRWSPDPP